MRWSDSEASRLGRLARQVRLNLWVVAALTGLGLIRVGFDWPAERRWALIPLGVSLAVVLGAVRLPWESLVRRSWIGWAIIAWFTGAMLGQFLYCLGDPDADVMFPVTAMMIIVAAATTTGARTGIALGLTGLAGYGALMATREQVDVPLSASVVAVMAVICGLCVLTTSNRRETHAQRIAAEHRAAALLENGSDAVIAISGGEVQYVSSSTDRVLGRDAAALTMADLVSMIHPEEAAEVDVWLDELRSSAPGSVRNLAARSLHADGSWIDVEVTATNHLADPDVSAIILSIRDVSEQKALQAELTRQAFEDTVTGLPNRALLRDRVATAVRRHARRGGRVSLLLIDLDEFKKINDTLGHAAGDEFLRTVAQRLTMVVRPSDTLARLGGDEFAVLVEELDDLGLHTLAQRLLESIKLPVRIGTNDLIGTASVGIATIKAGQSGDVDATDELMRDADLAMYAAKGTGRDRVAVFEESMYEAAVAEAEAHAELERGLLHDEFVVNYQPIVDLPSGTLIGVEALARWQHPARGLIGPDTFIAHAERTGLIVPLGDRVLRLALQEVASWHRDIPGAQEVRVSVNLSARQFQEPDLLATVRSALDDSGINPDQVVLEITESLLMQDVDAAVALLHDLRALGVRIAIDDFGTGYSSLSYLRRFPIDILKIDKAFVDGIAADRDDATLAEAVVGLGQALRLKTVAEGIEHIDQKSILAELGCTYGQGYLFARPGSAAEIADLVRLTYGETPQVDPAPPGV